MSLYMQNICVSFRGAKENIVCEMRAPVVKLIFIEKA